MNAKVKIEEVKVEEAGKEDDWNKCLDYYIYFSCLGDIFIFLKEGQITIYEALKIKSVIEEFGTEDIKKCRYHVKRKIINILTNETVMFTFGINQKSSIINEKKYWDDSPNYLPLLTEQQAEKKKSFRKPLMKAKLWADIMSIVNKKQK